MDSKEIQIFGCAVNTRTILLLWIFLNLLTADFSRAFTPTRSGMESDQPSSFRKMQQKGKGHRYFTDRGYATRTPEILATKKNYTVKRGSLAILHCTVQNLGTKTVVWRRASEENPLTVGEYTYVSDARFSTQHKARLDQWNLHIRNVSLEDDGPYECQVSTKDRSIRRQFILDVQDWPRYNAAIKITGKKFVQKGEPILLSCNATDYYAPHDIDWFKDGYKLDSDEFKGIEITKSLYLVRKTITSVLKIRKAKMADAGNYLCRTSQRYIATIHVQVFNAIKITGKKFVEKGEPILLSCNATDYYAPHDIDWFKDGDKLDSDEFKGIEITKSLYLARKTITSVLKIRKAKMADAGDYLCRTSERYITTIHVQVLNAYSPANDNNVKRGTHTEYSRGGNQGPVIAPALSVHLLAVIILFLT